VAAAIVLAVVAVYARTAGFAFVFDDDQYLVQNTALRGGLTLRSLGWAFTSLTASNWHPLTWISHLLDVALFGMQPGPHHLTNLLLHAAGAVLLLLALRALTGALWPSAFVAAAFALHPLHVESVAWVSERKDVLSGVFWMLTLLAYARYARRPSAGRYALVAAAFALGLLAKPMLVTLPFVLLLLDFWPLGRLAPRGDRTRAALLEKLPLLVLSAASAVVTYEAQWRAGAIDAWGEHPLGWRVGNALLSYVAYLGKTIWPSGLAAFYPASVAPIPALPAVAALLLLLALTVAAVALGARRGYLLAGWLWYLGTLVPVIGLVKVGSQSMADRYTYLPLVGVFVAVAWGAADAAGRMRRGRGALLAWGAAVWLAAMAVVAAVQAGTWRDNLTLYGHAVAVTEGNYFMEANLGTRLLAAGRTQEALGHLEEALRIAPAYPEAHNALGWALTQAGRLREGETHLREATGKPGYLEAQCNLAENLARQGRAAEAFAIYDAALRRRPDDPVLRNALGSLLLRQGRTEEARAAFEGILRAHPDSAEAHYNLGLLLASGQRYAEALGHLAEAVRLRPDYAAAHNNLGGVLALLGRTGEAEAEYLRALAADPGLESARFNLEQLRAASAPPGAGGGARR
jgi:tetratricopeptide (TPR) repeat protein